MVLRLRQGIEEAANGWEQAGRDEYYLIHKGSRLLEAERLRDDPRFGVFGLEREYVRHTAWPCTRRSVSRRNDGGPS